MNIEDLKCCGNCCNCETNSMYGLICVHDDVPEDVARHVPIYFTCDNWESDGFDVEDRLRPEIHVWDEK